MTNRAAAGRRGVMGIVCGLPSCRGMAGIALLRRGDVGNRLGERAPAADSHVSAAMAGRTLACRSIVAHRGGTESHEVGVTDVAGVVGRDVIGWLGQSGTATLVTVGALVVADGHRRRCRSVIEGGGGPGRGRLVTFVALLCRGDVVGRLGLCVLADVAAVVAGGALAGQTRMVHRAHEETRGAGVAGVALAIVGDVGAALAERGGAVVASRALADSGSVVGECCRLPLDGGVAGVACRRGGDMAVWFPGARGAVVTGAAGAGCDGAVVEGGRRPGQGVVAGVAGGDRGDVLDGLARRIDAVMAGQASAFFDAVVTEDDQIPGDGAMTGVTGLGGGNVLDGELHCAEAGGIAVARRTVAGSAAEHALGMTGFTTRLNVLAGQYKPGGRMIEGQGWIGTGRCGVRRLREGGTADKRQQYNQQHSNGARQTSAHLCISPDGDQFQVAQH